MESICITSSINIQSAGLVSGLIDAIRFPLQQAHVSSWPLGLTLLEELQDDVIGMLLSMVTAESHLSVWG